MRILKKILRIIAIILPCFCFGLISSPTYAHKYIITSMNAVGMNFPPYYTSVSAPWIEFDSESVHSSNEYTWLNFPYFNSNLFNDGSACNFSYASEKGYVGGDDQGFYSNYAYVSAPFGMTYYKGVIDDNPNLSSTFKNEILCRSSYPYLYDDGSGLTIPRLEKPSITSHDTFTVNKLYPYRMNYTAIPFNSERSVGGFNYSASFDLNDLLPQDNEDSTTARRYYTSHISSFRFPLNFDSSFEDVSSYEISGSFILGSGLSSSELSNLNLVSYIHYENGDASSDCTMNINPDDRKVVDYICYDDDFSSVPFPAYSYAFDLHLFTDDGYFTTYDQSWTFSNVTLVLNDDYTINPDTAGYGSFNSRGSDIYHSPGYPDVNDDENLDWFSSITSMFDFNFLNPFTAFFSLFTDNSGCVSIRTIAGMINSSETTYCPWFNSSTRNILTPVLGIAGIMLIFGFLVHWLGSSSGNLFEDSSKGGK